MRNGLVYITTDLGRKYTIDLKDVGVWCILETSYKSTSLDECLQWLEQYEQHMLENHKLMYSEE